MSKAEKWAYDRAYQEHAKYKEDSIIHTFARYIEAHEERPVSPELKAARRILSCYLDEVSHADIMAGKLDKNYEGGIINILAILEEYKNDL